MSDIQAGPVNLATTLRDEACRDVPDNVPQDAIYWLRRAADELDRIAAERDALQEENAALYCRLLKLDLKWAELMSACKVNHDLADHVYDVFKAAVWEKQSNDL